MGAMMSQQLFFLEPDAHDVFQGKEKTKKEWSDTCSIGIANAHAHDAAAAALTSARLRSDVLGPNFIGGDVPPAARSGPRMTQRVRHRHRGTGTIQYSRRGAQGVERAE